MSELKTSENLPVCIAQRDRRKLLDARKEQIQIDFISETDTEGENISFAIDPNVGDGDGRALQRAESTGFVLDDDEDPFSGDGLEHERAWMANFRHRSANPSRSASGKNSSRYSFSSDFSSDLEELYEHFEEMMTQGPIREDPSYVGRLRDKLKRTLSDSLTSLPRAIQEFPRSLSLSEKMQQEKLGIECAKRNVPRFTDCLLRERSAERSKESNSAMASQDCPSSRLLQGTGILVGKATFNHLQTCVKPKSLSKQTRPPSASNTFTTSTLPIISQKKNL